ncbi:D-sedoheptulose-7-phosphate isomerase [Francisella orientalis]|uniref:Phosphoheptose isomerase n=1 Tax=Francisella orientalis TaxID=299583 RepID=A0AAP7FVK8_9GAMM|nr:SIS domain-containing protein [Francisella orientalis]AFJ42643.1 phosphoheptose isomerase [Francisella orientalis str. Toba 04]AHB97797.1 DnaA initiator-associating protein DiaA [Francisella orientalis LADL 07-285A]AKN84890.1 Phosphoheptose isomerase [Francisella orientalis FNO12]AKN86428.1 Phosphoheptose isomerase [Francisella orientalis FNO24]AKN87966.1 Phosphoheptose isomerase [Francisella orientalis]
MTSLDKINSYFESSIQAKIETANVLPPAIAQAVKAIVSCLEKGGKILVCGNGGSAAIAQHFTSKLLNHFDMERPPLPAIALTADVATITAIGDRYGFAHVFSKQVAALGNEDDILLVISANGDSQNIINAVEEAHDLDMKVVALTGANGGRLQTMYNLDDIELRVPSDNVANIQENHFLIIHCLCDIIDQKLFVGLED